MNQELRIIVRADGTAQVVRQLDTVNNTMSATQAKSGAMASGMSANFAKIASALGLAALGFTLLRKSMDVLKSSVENARMAEIAVNKLNNAIDNSAIASKISSLQMRNLATEMQRVSNFGDEDIMNNVTNSLLKFRNIGADVFPRVQKNVLDLAEAMGGGESSLLSASRMVGMAMGDPILGLTRLRRAGVLFTETQQDTIKSLVELGKTTEAQSVLLAALEQNFGGAAQAGINSATQLKNAWGDYLEGAGNGFNSFITSMNIGMTSFLYTQTAAAQSSADIIEKAIINSRIKQANFMSGLLLTGKGVLLTIGMTSITVWGVISDALDTVYLSMQNIKSMTLSIFNGLGSIAPRIMETITGVSSLKDALDSLKDDFADDVTKNGFGLDAFGASTKRNIEGIRKLFNEMQSDIERVTAFNSNAANAPFAKLKLPELDLTAFDAITEAAGLAGESASANIDHILSLNDTEMQAVTKKYARMTQTVKDYYANNLITAAQYNLALNEIGIAETNEITKLITRQQELYKSQADAQAAIRRQEIAEELEAHKQLMNDKMSAQLAYLQAVQPLSQATLNAQLEAYKTELAAYEQLGISKLQIDEMVNQRRLELERQFNEGRLEEWKANNAALTTATEGFIGSFAQQLNRMMMIQTSSNNLILQGFVGFINSMISELNRYIAQLLIVKAISMLAFGGNPSVTSDWYYNMPAETLMSGNTSSPTPSMPSMPVTPPMMSGNSGLTDAIMELRDEIRRDRNIVANLSIDGRQLRSELKRVNNRVNSLASSR